MKAILGKKMGMSQIFREDGTVVPVTRVQAGPCVITQVKTKGQDTVSAVQIGFGEQKGFRLNKAEQGHLKGLSPVQYLRDVRVEDDNHGLERGDSFTVKIFSPGEKVQVTGTTKGKGFQGVVKRHGFAGSKATHGNKDQQRMPGSIGATGPARVFKGTRMGGHMGDAQVTVKNLEVVEVLADENELLVKGALPGARGGLLLIYTAEGNIDVEKPVVEETPAEAAVEEKKEEAAVAEAKAEGTEAKAKKEETPSEADNSADATVADSSDAAKEETVA